MSKPSSYTPEVQARVQALTRKWKTYEKTILNWQASGAPLDGTDDGMLRWLRGRHNVGSGTQEVMRQMGATHVPPVTPTSKRNRNRSAIRKLIKAESAKAPAMSNGHGEGAASALKRLEQQELSEFNKLQILLTDANADQFLVKSTRDNWLKISESLRKYDALVEQARRESGALLPREVAINLTGLVVANTVGSLQASLESMVPRLVGLSTPAEVMVVLREGLAKASKSMVSAVKTWPYAGSSAPPWLVEAVEEAVKMHGILPATPKGVDVPAEREELIDSPQPMPPPS